MTLRDKKLEQEPIWAAYAVKRTGFRGRVEQQRRLVATCRAASEEEAITVLDDALARPDRELVRIGEW